VRPGGAPARVASAGVPVCVVNRLPLARPNASGVVSWTRSSLAARSSGTFSRMALSQQELEATRRSRRHPRLTQHDYLHLRFMLDGLAKSLAALPAPLGDVLDVWCGTRPYDDLFPPGTRIVGFDVDGNPYGSTADVVSNEFLPFDDAAFDLVVCIQSFQYVPEPDAAISEFRRVLRPGGTALLALPFALEYDPRILERRFTGPQLAALFESWENVIVREYGGRSATWSVLTGSLVRNVELRASRPRPLRTLRHLFAGVYFLLNAVGLVLGIAEARTEPKGALPLNLVVTARRPA
jgi:SAM-dependent methyltransferase